MGVEFNAQIKKKLQAGKIELVQVMVFGQLFRNSLPVNAACFSVVKFIGAVWNARQMGEEEVAFPLASKTKCKAVFNCKAGGVESVEKGFEMIPFQRQER